MEVKSLLLVFKFFFFGGSDFFLSIIDYIGRVFLILYFKLIIVLEMSSYYFLCSRLK